MLDVRRMRVLREVAKQGSITHAARALSFTPSAVSQQIVALEREAGVALLERGPRSVRLTEAGRALVEHTHVIVSKLEAAEAEIRAIAGLTGGTLRVASFPTAYATLVPAAIRAFRNGRERGLHKLSLSVFPHNGVRADAPHCATRFAASRNRNILQIAIFISRDAHLRQLHEIAASNELRHAI